MPAHRILVGHSDGRADHAYHRSLAEQGAYVGFDRFGIEMLIPDAERIESVVRMVEAGYTRSLCLSHDSICAGWMGRPVFAGKVVVHPDQIGYWAPSHIFKKILPELAVCCYGPNKAAADLQWRYVEHPTFRYELRVAVDSGSRLPLGLLVYRVEPILGRRERVVRVVEILGRPQAVQSLLTAAIDEARQHGALFLDVHSTHREIGEILERNGLRRTGSDGDWPGFPSLFQPFESGHVPIKGALWTSRRLELAYGPLAEAPELYLVKSDSDQDRPNVLDLEG